METINNLTLREGNGIWKLISPDGSVYFQDSSKEYLSKIALSCVDYLEKITLPRIDTAAIEVVSKELNRIGFNHDSDGIRVNEMLQVLVLPVEYGDWKHEHLYIDHVMTTRFNLEKMGEEITHSDGTDCYSSIHIYGLPVSKA